ncbi:hypothetical protein [Chitinophaga vietnamensis]|uniref:hypothetical protein n=1 Tax=Chitinophaga vietnamensis TaxID=2593957 RepID=UPI0013763961|nr:hypothetical protein [Chitinophaga vietnamensis]
MNRYMAAPAGFMKPQYKEGTGIPGSQENGYLNYEASNSKKLSAYQQGTEENERMIH